MSAVHTAHAGGVVTAAAGSAADATVAAADTSAAVGGVALASAAADSDLDRAAVVELQSFPVEDGGVNS